MNLDSRSKNKNNVKRKWSAIVAFCTQICGMHVKKKGELMSGIKLELVSLITAEKSYIIARNNSTIILESQTGERYWFYFYK